jgi:hypothetical protein
LKELLEMLKSGKEIGFGKAIVGMKALLYLNINFLE